MSRRARTRAHQLHILDLLAEVLRHPAVVAGRDVLDRLEQHEQHDQCDDDGYR